LMQMLARYRDTLIIVSHDTELLRNCIDTIWHIDNNKIHEFTGSYDEYMREIKQKRAAIEKDLTLLKREKKDTHKVLMKEQKRVKKRKGYGEKKYAGDKLALRAAQAKGQTTCNKSNKFINDKKNDLLEQFSELYIPKNIQPKFSLIAENISSSNLLSISGADLGYAADKIILKNIGLSLGGKERVAICGKNASGKSTLLKAILGQDEIFTTGNWHLPRTEHIGYLDQHYSNLKSSLSVIEHIKKLRPDWTEIEARRHLNDFLFRTNEEVMQLAANLSGGEKARASLSMIAAKTPRLLILDEVTNNLDLETKEHVIQVLKEYPGAMIIVSHEEDFLEAIGIEYTYTVADGKITF